MQLKIHSVSFKPIQWSRVMKKNEKKTCFILLLADTMVMQMIFVIYGNKTDPPTIVVHG